jgi:hypothetical protein
MANVWVLITIGLGFFFYGLRCRQRLYYGLTELAVALVIIFLTFHPPAIYLITDEYSFWGWLLSKGVGFLVGVYAMVRGLDNIEQGTLVATCVFLTKLSGSCCPVMRASYSSPLIASASARP